MQALVLYPDGRYRLEDTQKPKLGKNSYSPRDVILEIAYCGICGSDIHGWNEDRELHGPEKPVVGGHEIAARVLEVGKEVEGFKKGDRVVCEIVTFYCDDCKNCRSGHYNVCARMPVIEQRAHYRTGGGFARYAAWPARHLHHLPEGISLKEAVLMETTAGAVHSVIETMRVEAGEMVVILGPGARGLILSQVARACGAEPVVITGLSRDRETRLKLAEKLGVDYTVDVETEDLHELVMDLTSGQGADVVIENTGSERAVEETFDLVRPRGRILISGGGIRGGITAGLDTWKLITKELEVRGEISHVWTSWKKALKLVETGQVNLEPLVSEVYDLEDWQEGFELAATSQEVVRVAIQP